MFCMLMWKLKLIQLNVHDLYTVPAIVSYAEYLSIEVYLTFVIWLSIWSYYSSGMVIWILLNSLWMENTVTLTLRTKTGWLQSTWLQGMHTNCVTKVLLLQCHSACWNKSFVTDIRPSYKLIRVLICWMASLITSVCTQLTCDCVIVIISCD